MSSHDSALERFLIFYANFPLFRSGPERHYVHVDRNSTPNATRESWFDATGYTSFFPSPSLSPLSPLPPQQGRILIEFTYRSYVGIFASKDIRTGEEIKVLFGDDTIQKKIKF
jgi:hypothetical protein